MEKQLQGRVALITGAGSGIGCAIAQKLSQEGAKVAVNDLHAVKAQATVEKVRRLGGEAIAAAADISDYHQVQAMVNEVLNEYGEINILVNNAGVLKRRLFVEMEAGDWHEQVNVNLYGMLNCTKAVLQQMIEIKYGKIINISSDAARTGEPRLTVYAATKAAVLGFTRALAQEVGRYNININAICPGATWTPLVNERLIRVGERAVKAYPLQRFAEPLDIANGVLFLSSDLSSYITGQTLSISGGYTTI